MSLSQTYPGLRVLDLATNIAGPFAAMILGDMGADVIKVERRPAGDDTRALPPFADGEATVFLAVNRNKRSIVLDYKEASDREILKQLIESADVLIESFPPGVADRLGLAWTDLTAINPRLVVASVSAFGSGSIGKTMPGYDALVQAVSGLMSFTGNEGDPTVRIAPSILDLSTGMWTAMGVMAALTRRNAPGGTGEHVRLALIDTAFNVMNHQLLGYLATGEQPGKLGAGAPSAAPYGVYQAADGEILIATASGEQFVRLCDALGLEDAKYDRRFQTMGDRIAHRRALDALISGAVRAKTIAELMTLLDAARISAGKVNSVDEACKLQVVHERELFRSDGMRSVPQLRLPVDDGSSRPFRSPPALDQDRAEILAELSTRPD